MNAAIASLPDPSRKIQDLWGCQEEPNGDGGSHASSNVTPILDNNTAARWVKTVMKFNNPILFGIVYCGKQADGTAGSQMPMYSGCSYVPVDDILPPVAENMINDIREESDDDAEI